ncbi:hypothetical protein H6F87_17840 [Cyanobacteria bacterium FACHB-502]|jgi:hypothetical protein|nr:hypothetical protein [Cyanobacteria bacterium FACHB-502]
MVNQHEKAIGFSPTGTNLLITGDITELMQSQTGNSKFTKSLSVLLIRSKPCCSEPDNREHFV